MSVMQVAFRMMLDPNIKGVLKRLDMLAAIVAALGHDVDHPGNDNAMEVLSQSFLALRYNDISVSTPLAIILSIVCVNTRTRFSRTITQQRHLMYCQVSGCRTSDVASFSFL